MIRVGPVKRRDVPPGDLIKTPIQSTQKIDGKNLNPFEFDWGVLLEREEVEAATAST